MTVDVREISEADREVTPGDITRLRGRKLGALVEELNGFEGEVILRTTGERAPISLEQWRGRDPESTYLILEIRLSDEGESPGYTKNDLRFRLSPPEGPPSTEASG
jgi:hypothetical protein